MGNCAARVTFCGCISRAVLAVLSISSAAQAFAQSPRQVDCANPSSVVDRAICTHTPLLVEANRELTSLYQRLLSELPGPAKKHLAEDEARWVGYRDREDLNPENLPNSYTARLNRLDELMRGLAMGPYPFVSDHVVIENKGYQYGWLHADAHYPQFDGGGTGAATTNQFFAQLARAGLDKAQSGASEDFGSQEERSGINEDEYDQNFTLERRGPYLIEVKLTTYRYTGGAHGNEENSDYLVDLRTGSLVKN